MIQTAGTVCCTRSVRCARFCRSGNANCFVSRGFRTETNQPKHALVPRLPGQAILSPVIAPTCCPIWSSKGAFLIPSERFCRIAEENPFHPESASPLRLKIGMQMPGQHSAPQIGIDIRDPKSASEYTLPSACPQCT